MDHSIMTTDEAKQNYTPATALKEPEITPMKEKPTKTEQSSENQWKMATLLAGISAAAALTAHQLGYFGSYAPA